MENFKVVWQVPITGHSLLMTSKGRENKLSWKAQSLKTKEKQSNQLTLPQQDDHNTK